MTPAALPQPLGPTCKRIHRWLSPGVPQRMTSAAASLPALVALRQAQLQHQRGLALAAERVAVAAEAALAQQRERERRDKEGREGRSRATHAVQARQRWGVRGLRTARSHRCVVLVEGVK